MAAGEGFEPSQTESESVVLPLHNPAICWAESTQQDKIITSYHFVVKPFSNTMKVNFGLFLDDGFERAVKVGDDVTRVLNTDG